MRLLAAGPVPRAQRTGVPTCVQNGTPRSTAASPAKRSGDFEFEKALRGVLHLRVDDHSSATGEVTLAAFDERHHAFASVVRLKERDDVGLELRECCGFAIVARTVRGRERHLHTERC